MAEIYIRIKEVLIRKPIMCVTLFFQLYGLSILQPTRFQRVISYASHGFSLLMIPVGYTLPCVSTH